MKRMMEMILTLLQNGDYETARLKALAELKNAPENAELNYFAAWAHDALGKEDAAIPFMRKHWSLVFLMQIKRSLYWSW